LSPWKGEKLIRRQLIAEDYRIIMLIGDDFSDFVPCARKSVYTPCTQGATRASRAADVRKYANYWGNAKNGVLPVIMGRRKRR
jgi:acid phosphatase